MTTLRDGIVMFAPLPPRQNGIADYSFELLGGLARHLRCLVVVEDGTLQAAAPAGVDVLTEGEYRARAATLAHWPHVYQLGNNADHVYMLPHMMRTPGLVVLHDPSLHYLLDQATVARGGSATYAAALESLYGAAGRVLGRQFLAHGLRESAMFQSLRMTGAILGAARGVLAHSRYAAAQALAAAPGTHVTIAPHHVCPPQGTVSAASQRAALGVAEDEVMFLSLGFVTRAKQIGLALRALHARRQDLPPFQYVIAGAQSAEEFDAPALVAELGLGAHVKLLDYVEESAFFALARAADVVINLRHPIGGETSGTLIRALGTGACTVVVDRGPFAELPDGVAVKLPWDEKFQHRLGEALVRLAHDKAARARIGRQAAAHVATAHALERSVACYLSAIDTVRRTAPPPWASTARWEKPMPGAQAALREAARARLGAASVLPRWFLAGAVPRAAAPCRAAVLGATAGELALLDLLGHGAALRPHASDLATLPPRALDLLVLFTGAAPPPLAQCNAALAFGGRLALIAPEAVPATKPATALPEHGFHVELACQETPPSLDAQDEQDGDADGGACWAAVKYTEFGLPPAQSASGVARAPETPAAWPRAA
jgi:glycosyltransferase involved in cell wall biosynthesis